MSLSAGFKRYHFWIVLQLKMRDSRQKMLQQFNTIQYCNLKIIFYISQLSEKSRIQTIFALMYEYVFLTSPESDSYNYSNNHLNLTSIINQTNYPLKITCTSVFFQLLLQILYLLHNRLKHIKRIAQMILIIHFLLCIANNSYLLYPDLNNNK